MAIFDTTIQTAAGDVRLTVHDGSTIADLVMTGPRGAVTVYCGHRVLSELASATGAASVGQLTDPFNVETEFGVTAVGQPSGLVAVIPGSFGTNIAVDDCDGHFVDGDFNADECSRLSAAFAAASHKL